MADSVKTRAMQLAARLLGGPARLRDRLGARSSDVSDWLAGVREPPPEALLRAVEVILDDLDAKD